MDKSSQILRLITLLVLAFSCTLPVFSQDVNFTAYVLDLPSIQIQRSSLAEFSNTDQTIAANVSRIRLRPELFLGAKWRLGAEYEIASLQSSSDLGAFSLTPVTQRQLVDLYRREVDTEHVIMYHFLDRLYGQFVDGPWNVVVGRQRIQWGTGRIWNPVDLFNPLNPAVVAKIEKDGVDAVSVTRSLGQFSNIQLVYNPANVFETHNAAARLLIHIGTYDLAFIGGYFDAAVLGMEFAGNLWLAGFRGEILWKTENQPFVRAMLGLDYQINGRWYALAEYFFNSEGKTSTAAYEFDRLARGEIIVLSRNYLTTQHSVMITPLFSLSGGIMHGLNDDSGLLLLGADYAPGSFWSFQAGVQHFYGQLGDEYYFYPTNIYLSVQRFF